MDNNGIMSSCADKKTAEKYNICFLKAFHRKEDKQ